MVAPAKSFRETVILSDREFDEALRNRRLSMLDIGVLLATMAVFLLFLVALVRVVFPQGARLGDIVSDRQSVADVADVRGEVDLAGGAADALGRFIAHLGDVRRDVKIRAADSVAWTSASKGVTVRNRDAVQTFANSRARVDFTKDNELRIGQNSLIVFRSGAADPFLQRREPAVVVLGGELSGTVNADYGLFAVQFPAGIIELSAVDQSDDAVNFRVGINPDESSTLAIYSGQADVNIAGQNYRVSANHGLTVSADGKTAAIAPLPGVPMIQSPARDMVARYLDSPPRIGFRWGAVPEAQAYRLEIARDSNFDELIVDEYLNSTRFTHGNLSPGQYSWRVSSRVGWTDGPPSIPRRLNVVRDSRPPSLELEPIERAIAGSYVLRGKTSNDARVYVFGELIDTSAEGKFEYVFNPEPGTQSIVVEAVDAVGNVAYSSQVLHVPSASGRSD